MSFDRQNFARSVKEQQAGISPQMWPIICPDNGSLVVNHPYEISINPCDSIWLPFTYDKSYGLNPMQNDQLGKNYFPGNCGANLYMVRTSVTNPAYGGYADSPIIIPPLFSLRFNSPNNPWLLWGLGHYGPEFGWGTGTGAAQGLASTYCSSLMRSISGPISRMWIQYNVLAQFNINAGARAVPGMNQLVFMSMLGFSQSSFSFEQHIVDTGSVLTAPPVEHNSYMSCGSYKPPDLNSADLLSLGVKPVATTTSKL